MFLTSLNRPLAIALTLGLGLALPAAAQEAPAEGTAAGSDLSMGQAPADGVGSTYVKASFESWEQRCVKSGTDADPCQLYQLLKDASGNSVAEIGMFSLPEGGQAAAGATIIAPLETLLTGGVRIGIDEAEPKIYPFTFCSQVGCVARVGFTAEEVAAFKAGNKATLTIVPAVAPDKTVALEISLKGFTAGYDAVAESQVAAAAAAAAAAPAEGAAEEPQE
ncbi:invasion associated locus B family protein [Rhodobacteraceae bacterium HSP-20]|uniref:Invasion associated locus B family protein n=1 Tax=Paragemmobacter amnigenus TaxID=2852097 RepID=A0ABS6J6N8_9RHOB|nr:invasion associated locus B family protein [Rhodobacter amnigenus]MBU9699426.1 invasion associated locus B family protein [Rhodobacter amnigenus]MBV4390653.1 invasion associated locus B family protein [Rhodobacter amnigenus]